MKKFMAMFLAGILLLAGPGAALAQSAAADFADIKGHWGEPAIREVCDQGVMQGMGIDQQGLRIFVPDGTVTRAQAATVLTQTFKLDYGSQRFIKQPLASDYYQDVDNQAWYASAAVMCAINKILNDGEQFFPERPITRIEMARAIKGSFDAKGISIPMIMVMPLYDDIDQLSPGDVQVIAFVTNTGIMKGNDGCFRPEDTLTRAELAQIFRQCLNVMKNQLVEDVPDAEQNVLLNPKTFKDQSENITIDLQIPVISGLENEQIQSALNSKWEKEARDFQEEIASNLEDYVKECQEQGYPVRPYEVITRCQVGSQSQDRLSLYVDYYQYTGGAHGLTERRAYNIDLKTGKELTLKDLFSDDCNYQEDINRFIQNQINAHPESYFTDPETGGFTDIAEDQSFYLEDEFLVIYFGLYEIAPYASGIPEFRIPLNQLD